MKISGGHLPNAGVVHRVLPMKNLRVLSLRRCENQTAFINTLQQRFPNVVQCPKLEKLALHPGIGEEEPTTHSMGRMAGGAMLKTIRILEDSDKLDSEDVLGLGKHVLPAVCSPEVE